MHPGQPDNAHLRVSDNDREKVRQLLERAVGQGMLTLDEFTERTDRALAARTRGELNSVLADLPFGRPAMSHGVRPAPSGEPLVLRGRMSSLSRRGQWTVPPQLQLDTRMCDTTLDFTNAILQSQVIRVDIDDYCSSTTLILPAGATADLNAVQTVAGSVTIRVPTSPPSSRLHIVVRGSVRMGSVSARYGAGRAWRWLTGR